MKKLFLGLVIVMFSFMNINSMRTLVGVQRQLKAKKNIQKPNFPKKKSQFIKGQQSVQSCWSDSVDAYGRDIQENNENDDESLSQSRQRAASLPL